MCVWRPAKGVESGLAPNIKLHGQTPTTLTAVVKFGVLGSFTRAPPTPSVTGAFLADVQVWWRERESVRESRKRVVESFPKRPPDSFPRRGRGEKKKRPVKSAGRSKSRPAAAAAAVRRESPYYLLPLATTPPLA